MSTILAFLIRLALFAAFTFAFVVLYQHGPSGFVQGVPVEWNRLQSVLRKDAGDPAPPTPEVPPAPGEEPLPTP